MDKLGPWDNFILSALAFNGVPLLPIFIEWLFTQGVSDNSLVLTTAIYSASMFACTRKITFIALYFFVVVFQIALFGALNSDNFSLGGLRYFTLVCLFFVAGSQLFERYRMHVSDNRNFFGD